MQSGELSNEILEKMIQANLIGIIITENDGQITHANDYFLKMLGYTGVEIKKNKICWQDITPNEHKLDSPVRISELYTKGQVGPFFKEYLHKNGTRIPVMVGITLLDPDSKKEIAYVLDARGHVKTEEINAKLAAIVKYSDDAIISKTLEGIVTSWNKGAEKMYGYSSAYMVGRSIKTIFPPGREDEYEKIMASLRQGIAVDHYETERVRKNGELLNVAVTISPIFDSKNKIIGVSTIARDITQSKRVNEQLKFNASVAQSISDAVITTDTNYRVVSWNKASENLYGWTESEMTGQKVQNYLNTRFIISEKISWDKQIEKVGFWKGEVYQNHKSGKQLTILSSVSIVRDDAGKIIGFVAVNRDISDRKRFEDNLLFLANASKILNSSLDYKKTLTSIAKLAIPLVADWCSVIMIMPPNKITRLVLAHKDQKKVKAAKDLIKKIPLDTQTDLSLNKVFRTGKSELYTTVNDQLIDEIFLDPRHREVIKSLSLKSVMIVPIVSRHKVLGAIQFANTEAANHYTKIDLTMAEELASRSALAIENAQLYEAAQNEIKQRKKTEAILLESEERFRRLYDSNLIGIAFWDINGTVFKANNEYLRILGYNQDDFKHNKIYWEKVTPPEYSENDNLAIQQAMTTGVSQIYEKEYYRKDGTKIPILIGITFLQNSKQEGVAFVLDITERKKMEERKDEFIGIASHELKTPLTSIKGYTQILERYLQNHHDTKAQAYLDKTNVYIDRLNSLITDLLDVSKIQAGKLQFNMQLFDFDGMIKDSIDGIQPTASRHHIHLDGQAGKIIGDKERLEQVVTNLLSNAIKYSPKANKVEVKIKNDHQLITVSVKDFGIGIPKDQIDKIFTRFYRVDTIEKNYSGLGIGLYISHEIIRRHKGQLIVESDLGKGSTFTFTIPHRQ